MNKAIKQKTEGISIEVTVQPKSSRNEVAGILGDTIKIKLTAPPVDGKANDALIVFLSKVLGVSKSSISITRGETGRHKTIFIIGISAQTAEIKLNL